MAARPRLYAAQLDNQPRGPQLGEKLHGGEGMNDDLIRRLERALAKSSVPIRMEDRDIDDDFLMAGWEAVVDYQNQEDARC